VSPLLVASRAVARPLAAAGTRRRPRAARRHAAGVGHERGTQGPAGDVGHGGRAMTATAAAFEPGPGVNSAPMPPAPPQTILETGLHPDTLAQLMLKTLVAGESSGTQLSDNMRLPYSVLD